jgi:hypothetical protein
VPPSAASTHGSAVEWFVQELRIPHVHEPLGWRTACIAGLKAATDAFGKHARHLRTNCQRVHRGAERPPQSHVEAGDRRNTFERVAMQDNHVRIRVGREQRSPAVPCGYPYSCQGACWSWAIAMP